MKSFLLLIDPMRRGARHTVRETPESVKRQGSGGKNMDKSLPMHREASVESADFVILQAGLLQ